MSIPQLGNEFLAEPIYLADMITKAPRDHARDEWLLLSPLTVIVSKMNLSKDIQIDPTTHYHAPVDQKDAVKLAVTCQLPSSPLQYWLSTSSNIPDPGMMDDPCWSDSETSIEDHRNYHASTTELWDTFWSPAENCFHSPTCVIDARTEVPLCVQSLSPENVNFASSNLSGLNKSDIPVDLHRSDAMRTPHRIRRPALPPALYCPFPPSESALHHRAEFTHVPHRSWPVRVESQANRPQRRRAHTTPGTPAYSTVITPSNLSTCTTIDWQLSSSEECTPLYMRSPPLSPQLAPPLMELMQKSVFDDDDDEDDEDEEKSGIGAFVSKLHSRKASSNAGTASLGKASTKRPKRQSLKRCMSEANEVLKGVFGIKKAAF